MRRWRLLAAAIAIAAIAGVAAWVVSADARGALPPGNFSPTTSPAWPLTDAAATAVRDDALRRAAVRVAYPETISLGHTRSVPDEPAAADPIVCRYLHSTEPTGTSAKFDCVLDGGTVIKVKYSRNAEIHAEVAATRLAAVLGFPADDMTIVPRLRCYGCPRFPFFTMQLLAMTRATSALGRHGHDDGYTDFEWVAVERRFPAAAIVTSTTSGWAWWELARSDAPRADVDALRLLAMFLAHWDNKSENQRLVCLDDPPGRSDERCQRPLAMVQDLGSTFGPVKVNLAAWRSMPVWQDRERCTLSMQAFPWEGGTFQPVVISEEGRQQLARQLGQVGEADVRRLFADARFPEFQSATDDERDLRAWASAFRHRVDQILTAGPCPPVASRE